MNLGLASLTLPNPLEDTAWLNPGANDVQPDHMVPYQSGNCAIGICQNESLYGSLSHSAMLDDRLLGVGLRDGSFQVTYRGVDGQNYDYVVPQGALDSPGGGLRQLPGNVVAPARFNGGHVYDLMRQVQGIYARQAGAATAPFRAMEAVLGAEGGLSVATRMYRSSIVAGNLAVRGGGTTTLYRAVSEAEFQQVMQTGKFAQGPNSLGGKFFAESAADAARWGDRLQGAGNYRIISVELSTSTADKLMRWERLDGIGAARYGELDQLTHAIIRSVQ
jgi:hypothetical protein